MSGAVSYHAGKAAEEIVAKSYVENGFIEEHRRWKSKDGEIDLIVSKGVQTIFVEVKKSRCFASAAQRITQRQMLRIQNSAARYMSRLPNGLDSDVRFDVALVDERGAIDIIENVTVH